MFHDQIYNYAKDACLVFYFWVLRKLIKVPPRIIPRPSPRTFLVREGEIRHLINFLLGPKKSSLQDAGSRLVAFPDPRSRGDEMPDPALSPSRTQEDEITRCRIRSCRLLKHKKCSWREAGSRLLAHVAFLDQRSRVDNMPDLTFSPSCLLGPRKSILRNIGYPPPPPPQKKWSRRRGIILSSWWHF